MKSLTLNANNKYFGRSIKIIRGTVLLALAVASGATAQAQDRSFNQAQFYHESAEAHKIFSFKFNDNGIDEKSISFLESQKEIDFKNSPFNRKNKASVTPEDSNFIFKKPAVVEPNSLKNSFELTANLSQPFKMSPISTSVLNSDLDRFKPHDLLASARALKSAPNTMSASRFPTLNTVHYASAGTTYTHNEASGIALLP